MKNIHIIFTGGTIAMRTNAQGLLIPALSGDEIISAIPAIQNYGNIFTKQFSNIPSAQITPEMMLALCHDIIKLLALADTAGCVVVHGTDTMEETAFFLDAALNETDLNGKPVVLTGSMRGNDQLSADGMANLLGAVQVAASTSAKGRGAMIFMNDEIHSARYVRKMDTCSLNTFNSPQYGALGKIIHTHAGSTVYFSIPALRLTPNVNVSRETTGLPRVDIIMMYTGADSIFLEASVKAGAQAIVIQAVGAGNVNLDMYNTITDLTSQGKGVIISSRSPLGFCAPIYGYRGGGQTLAELGACFSHDLPAHKARTYAQLLLNNDENHNAINTLQQGFARLNPL